MSDAITVEGVSKLYRLGSIRGATLAEDFSRWWAGVRRQRGSAQPETHVPHARLVGREFWALDDVSFSVKTGQVLGIIGRNGAGKSTLLKILSQLTAPTSGRARIRGRVASLLEVGTGFHPDLTGRENIFLNGAILGMTKAEIRSKFDEIVSFSECEDFVDTPVKRYSSGMYVRLAFAVAAHLEPEILIVDEVLAVGDAAFQRKCLARMSDVSRDGRTILFVSHNIAAIIALCPRAILLQDGKLICDDETAKVLPFYHQDRAVAETEDLSSVNTKRRGSARAQFTSVRVSAIDSKGHTLSRPTPGSNLLVQLTVRCLVDFASAEIAVGLADGNRSPLIGVSSLTQELLSLTREQTATIEFRFYDALLRPGLYRISLWIGYRSIEAFDVIEDAMTFRIYESPGSPGGIEVFPASYQARFGYKAIVGVSGSDRHSIVQPG